MKQVNHGTVGTSSRARRAWSAAACLAAALATVGAGCGSSIAAYTVSGQPATVSHYKTFGVVIPDAADLKENQMHPETMQRLAALSVERMKGLGYQPVSAKDADLLIGLSPEARLYGPLKVVNESSREDKTLDEHFDAEGTLNVSFVDMRANQVVLKRVAKTRVNARLGDEQMQEIVAGVFENVPRAQLPADQAPPAQSPPAPSPPAQ
jgi:hypothetical protein